MMKKTVVIIYGFMMLFSLILTQNFNNNNGFKRHQVTIGVIFGEGEQSTTTYKAYKLATKLILDNKEPNNNMYDYRFKTVLVDNIGDSFQMSGAICQLLVDNAVAIIGPVHPRTMNTIRSITNTYDLLYLTISDAHMYAGEPDHFKKADRIIKIQPTYADALADYIYEQKWSRMLYIYDTEEALFRLRMLFELSNAHNYELSTDARFLQKKPNQFGKAAQSMPDNIIEYIDTQSRSYSKKQIILDLSNEQIKKETFQQLNYTLHNRADYNYVLLNADYLELNHSHLTRGGINITGFSLINYESPNVINFINKHWKSKKYKPNDLTLSDDYIKPLSKDDVLNPEAALMIDVIDVIRGIIETADTPHEPTQTTSSDQPCVPETVPMWTAKNLLPLLHKFSHTGLTGLIRFNKTGFRLGFTLGIQEARMKQNLWKVGYWTQGKGLHRFTRTENSLSKRLRKNKVRKVTSILTPPFLEHKLDKNGKIIPGQYQGFCVDLIKQIAAEMNFSYVINEVKDGKYGSFVNGSWNGMIGELINNKAELAIGPITITSSRERVVDFSTPFMEFGLSVMYTKISKEPPEMFAFMKPLSRDIWMCIAYAYLSVSVVLFLVSRLNPQEWNDNCYEADRQTKKSNGLSNEFSIFNSFWFSLSAFMQQGGDISPKSLSGRIVGGVWWFFTLILVSSYTANLAAYLTKERMTNTIESFEDLARQSKIKYGVVDSGSSMEFFSKSNLDTFKRMWQFMSQNEDVFVKTIQEGYEKVLKSKGEYAFLLESTMNKYYNLQNGCQTTKIGNNLDSGKGYGVATPPGSDLRDGINLAILKLKEKNIIPQMTLTWWDNRTKCNKEEESEKNIMAKNSVKLTQIEGLFLLLLGGLAVGLFLSILELFYKCGLETRRQNKPFLVSLKEMINRSKGRPHNLIEVALPEESYEEEKQDTRVMFAI